jgi:hypothetical protein
MADLGPVAAAVAFVPLHTKSQLLHMKYQVELHWLMKV